MFILKINNFTDQSIKIMEEPISYFLNMAGFDRAKIVDWVMGDMYVGLINTDGNVGVCATLGTRMDDSLFYRGDPDIRNPVHRIILNAWFNSIFNYNRSYDHITDIFDGIDFRQKSRIVMVGYFESLYEKFSKAGIDLKVFDIQKQSVVLNELSEIGKSLSECNTLILTGTTIFNNTFLDIIEQTSDNCVIYLLGPSNILSEDMFLYKNIKLVFGSVFRNGDKRVFDKIAAGHGTRGFLEYIDKVYIAQS